MIPSAPPQIGHRPTKTLIVGASGTGKTTLLIRRIATAAAANVFCSDQEGELSYRLGVTTADPLDLEAEADASRVMILDPADTPLPNAECFEGFCQWVFQRAQRTPGRKILVVDELQRITTTNAGGMCQAFVDILERGRRAGLDVLVGSQAPNLLNNRLRAQVTEVCAFRIIDGRAADWLDPLLHDAAARLLALPRGAYIRRNLDTGEENTAAVF